VSRRRRTPAPVAVLLWRRLDEPGHDACGLWPAANGWRLSGAAAFREAGLVCQLRYEVLADQAWRTRRATVSGTAGRHGVELRIASAARGGWALNGVAQPGLAGCVDVDLGFTPATNLLPIRRLALKIGQRAEAPAAYLEFPRLRLLVLPQVYRRVSATRYAYESPAHNYAATLQVTRIGAIADYPGVFKLVTSE
jgi:uncharacterized protein